MHESFYLVAYVYIYIEHMLGLQFTFGRRLGLSCEKAGLEWQENVDKRLGIRYDMPSSTFSTTSEVFMVRAFLPPRNYSLPPPSHEPWDKLVSEISACEVFVHLDSLYTTALCKY